MSTLSVQTITGTSNIALGNTVVNTTAIAANSANISGVLTSGNTSIIGFANISSTLASGNVTVTGFANISSTLASGNLTVTGSANITSNTLNIVSRSLTSNGYTYLTNGLIFQWGEVTANSSSAGDITFPIPFTTSLYSITATCLSTVNSTTYNVNLLAANTTTANVRSANATSRSVYWQAIGI